MVHHRTCSKIWWRSAKLPSRSGGEKERIISSI